RQLCRPLPARQAIIRQLGGAQHERLVIEVIQAVGGDEPRRLARLVRASTAGSISHISQCSGPSERLRAATPLSMPVIGGKPIEVANVLLVSDRSYAAPDWTHRTLSGVTA